MPFSDSREGTIVLFGLSRQAEFAYEKFKNRCQVFISDNNHTLWNTTWRDDVVILPPDKINTLSAPLVIITSGIQHQKSIARQLSLLKIPHVSWFAFDIACNLSKCEEVHALLKNSEIYLSLLYAYLESNYNVFENIYEDNQYFVPSTFKQLNLNDVIVDAGAYVGDTLEQFIWEKSGVFKSYYAFEPGDRQFHALRARTERIVREWALDNDTIVLEKRCLSNCSEETGSLFINSDVLLSTYVSSEASLKIPSDSIDNYFSHRADNVTFIKIDTEGFEMPILQGGEEIIKKSRPRLAVSIYHKPEDFYIIPLYLHKLVPEYKMEVHHHSMYRDETILYCSV